MDFFVDLAGLIVFRAAAVRRRAARRALVAAWLSLGLGFLAFTLARSAVYAEARDGRVPSHGIMRSLLQLNLIQAVAFLALLYIPAVICLSNASAGDGLGFSFSREEYRRHVSVLFPAWGFVLLVAAGAQLAAPRFLAVGPVEISFGLVVLGALATAYSVWLIKELNYISFFASLGVFVLSWATLPVFYLLSGFVLALPLLIMFPLAYMFLQRVRDLLGAGGRERALATHLQALTTNPRDADAHYQLGVLHHARGNLAAAEGYYAAAIEIEPNEADYHYQLGRVFEDRAEWTRAREQYEETFRLNPEFAQLDIAREVGKAYLNTGEVEKAIEFLTFFLDRRASDAEARYCLALAHERLGRRDAMKTELSTLLEQARSNPRFFRKVNRKWIYRARVLLRGSTAG
jgi:tetratricopeptide (TPR) repeat protein